MNGKILQYTFEGELIESFEDLVELEERKRKDEISELLKRIEDS